MTTLKNILNITGIGLLFLIPLITSCGLEKESTAIDELNVRIPADPERLNPMLSSSGYATQIEDHIFMSLFAQDPVTLQYVPMLAAGKPIVKEGPLFNEKRSTAYTYTIREEAEWSDGRPVTAEDYIFSIKLALNPYVASASWKGFLQFFLEAEADSDNPKKFKAYADRDYMHSMEITSSFAVYPRHIYDPENLLSSFTIPGLKNYREDSLSESREKLLQQLADEFQTARFSTKIVEGAGPYRLVEYESGQRITLAKKENWWGSDLLNAGPEKINYFI
nr:hypothetical protein [Saprospiraceae bacterium]